MSYTIVQHTPLPYNAKAGASKTPPVIAVQPINAPQLKVKPRNNCGKFVTRFINGYVATNGKDIKPKICVLKSNWYKTTLPNPNCAPKKATAFGTVILPDAIGLFFVLSTLASTFLSQMSLMVHPVSQATRLAENKAVMVAIFSVGGGIVAEEESKIDHKDG